MKRRVLIILLAMLAISLVAIPAFGAEPIKINLNGYKLSSDVDPVVIKGRTVVPARVIAESLGADVQWDSSKQTATIIKNDTKITVKVNATLAEKNGETIALDSPAILKEGKLMLPLRFFAENFGADVGWDGKTREVKVNLAETKDGMSPEQYLIACNEAMSKITTAKINTSIQMNIGSSEAGRSLNMNADFQGCIRSPQECYIIGKIKMPPEIQEKDMQIEVYTDGQKACVRLDGGEWEEQTIPQTPETLKPLSGTGSDPSEILKQI
ncbi:MAG: stalk domain-containing protein, partial [Chitinophagales bacterium]